MMLKIKLLIPLIKSGWFYTGLLVFVLGVKFYAAGGFQGINQYNHDWLKWVSDIALVDNTAKPKASKQQQLIYLTTDFSDNNSADLALLLQNNPDSQIVISAKPNKQLAQHLQYLLQLQPRGKSIIWAYDQMVSLAPIDISQNNNSVFSALLYTNNFRFYRPSSVRWRTAFDLIYAPVMAQNDQSTAIIWQADDALYLNYLGQIIKQQSQSLEIENDLLSSQLRDHNNTISLGFSAQLKPLLSTPDAVNLKDYLILTNGNTDPSVEVNQGVEALSPAIILISDSADPSGNLVALQIEAWLQNELYYQSFSAELCFIILVVLAIGLSLVVRKTKLLHKLIFIVIFGLAALSLQVLFYWQQQWLDVMPILVFLIGFNLIAFCYQREQLVLRGSNLAVKDQEHKSLPSVRLEEISEHDKQELAAQATTESLERTLLITDNQANTSTITQAIYKIESFGRYKVEGILGKGAMGIVYQGVDPKINRHVAIKTLQLNDSKGDDLSVAKSRFFKEAETAGNLSHANIVTIYDVGEEADLGYIAMDLLTGAPLSKYSKPGTCLPVALVYQLMIQITDALDYAHNQQVVHRDIKPGNIIFDDEKQRVTVTDFGIAFVADNSKTSTGTIMGSPYYMSPEQVLGQQVDGRSDIFSLGVTFYQLLTGYLPFEGDSIASVAYQITQVKQAPIKKWQPKLPSSATRITNKAMHKDIEKRYQTMAEFKQALINALKRDFKKAPII
jgi:eukaryotic-like serine/threonine-protein kinase